MEAILSAESPCNPQKMSPHFHERAKNISLWSKITVKHLLHKFSLIGCSYNMLISEKINTTQGDFNSTREMIDSVLESSWLIIVGNFKNLFQVQSKHHKYVLFMRNF